MKYVLNQLPYNPRYYQRTRMRSMWRRHGNQCPYCHKQMTRKLGYNHPSAPSRDHIIPLSRGGPDSLDNLTLCCRACNEHKGNLTAEEYIACLEGRASRLVMR